MDTVPLHGDLQIDQDLRFSRREWRVQHIGWLLMVLVIVAALLGVFGGGIASRARVSTSDGRLLLSYERMAHHEAPDMLRLEAGPGTARDGTVRVWIDRAYLQERDIESIVPVPARSTADGDRIIYDFTVGDPAQPTNVVFHTIPGDMWRQAGRAGLVGGDSLRFSQIVLP